jgi:glycosyltransferase involved in cell wall biosynthesis
MVLTLFLALLLAAWSVKTARVAWYSSRLPRMENLPPAEDAACPPVSIVFAARNEEEKLAQGLETLAGMDYPALEIIAVDDRSHDATPRILETFAHKFPGRLRVLRIEELPPGWMGKPHALERGCEEARHDWIVFTDADVRFAPDLLRRAMTFATRERLDHLTLLGDVDMHSFWERVIISFFALAFHVFAEPGRVAEPESKQYIGVGAFQLVRRDAYVRAGSHRRLRMEVVDDLKLGKIIKRSGGKSAAALAPGRLAVRWHSGPRNIVRGVTKNFFAAAEFRLPVSIAQCAALWLMNVLPFALLPAMTGWNLWLCAGVVAELVGLHAGVCMAMRISPLYALTHPAGAAIFSWMGLRSAIVTLRQGGVVWRDTFYPLEELRKGLV